MFKCQNCGSLNTYCIDSYPRSDGTVYRRRICADCAARFSTTERYVPNDLIVKHKSVAVAERISVVKDLCSRR